MKQKISALLLLMLLFGVACETSSTTKADDKEATTDDETSKTPEAEEAKPTTKMFKNITFEQLGQELGVEVEDLGVKFSGKINYLQTTDGEMVKHGPFEMAGDNITDLEPGSGAEMEKSYQYTGNFANGTLDGLFTRTSMAADYGEEAQVYYENGKCIWSAVDWGGEGEEHTYREEQAEDCSFAYIQQKGLNSL